MHGWISCMALFFIQKGMTVTVIPPKNLRNYPPVENTVLYRLMLPPVLGRRDAKFSFKDSKEVVRTAIAHNAVNCFNWQSGVCQVIAGILQLMVINYL